MNLRYSGIYQAFSPLPINQPTPRTLPWAVGFRAVGADRDLACARFIGSFDFSMDNPRQLDNIIKSMSL